MATRMKKVDTKPNNVSVDVEENDIEELIETPVSKKTAKTKKEFAPSDYILCKSVTAGGLSITCKSGAYHEFKNYGSETEIEYRDLVALVRKGSDHIFNPRILIMDDDFLNEFPHVKKMYDELYTSSDLKEILDLPINQMIDAINKLPSGAKETLKSVAASQIANGKVDSIKKVRALTEIYDSDFNLLSELFG